MMILESHIVLIGFMGSGKSTVGKPLADALNVPFVDMDEYIENQEGKEVKAIFHEHGESYFRDLETRVLAKLLSETDKIIISTGGGTPCFNNNMDVIRSKSISFYLRVGVDPLMKRLSEDTNRPLLQGKTKSELKLFIKKSIRARSEFYNKADYKMRGNDLPTLIVKRIIEKLRRFK